MPFVCHSLGPFFGFLKMCPNVLMGLKAVLMLALPQIRWIRSDTPWTYGMAVKVFRWLLLSCRGNPIFNARIGQIFSSLVVFFFLQYDFFKTGKTNIVECKGYE